MPRIAYLSKSEEDYFLRLETLMELARESLEVKRNALERLTDLGLFPYSRFYLRNIKQRFKRYWSNHFSTIGLIGMNEACLNFLRKNIATQEGIEFSLKVLNFMREKLKQFQEETGNLYNLEATPGEGTSYRLALIDKKKFPNIITAGKDEPYYTNSTQLPVDIDIDLFEALTLQDKLQQQYTGGTVFHCFLGERIDDPLIARDLVMKVIKGFRLPYFTLTPTFSICPNHGYLRGEIKQCPTCRAETEVYSRVVGYFRPVSQWNKGKAQEFQERQTFSKLIKEKVVLDNVSRNKRNLINRLPRDDSRSSLYNQLQLPLPILS
jgi:ribonucleoside-triphosphate reductase